MRESKDYAMFVVDAGGCFATWNEGVGRVLGYSEDEFVGKPFSTIFTPEDRNAGVPERELSAAARDGRSNDERWHLRKDNTRFWCEGVTTAITSDEGDLLGFSKIMRDATRRKQAEDALAESESRFRRIIETAREGIWTIDPAGYTLFCNARLAEILGTTVADVCAGSAFRYVFPEDLEAAQRLFGLKMAGDENPFEFRLRRADGTAIWASVSGTSMANDRGHVIGLLGMFTDISERKAAEAALRLSESRFRSAFARAPLGMVLTDLEGRLLQANDAYCEITGYSGEELSRTDFPGITHPEDVEANRRIFQDLVAGRIPSFVMDKRYVRKDGDIVWVRATATLLRDESGVPVEVVGLVENITPQKRAEQALQRSNEELSRFAYVVSHDLQSPLRGVRTHTELLARRCERQLDAKAGEYIRFIVERTSRMEEMIHSLLQYAQAAGEQVALEDVDLERVFESALAALRVEIDDAAANVTHDPLPRVVGEPVLLGQVLQNLVSNAVKYRRSEPPRVHVRAERRSGSTYVVSVSDNGMGIPPGEADRIFTPLQRLHGSEIPGTGIGLAICKRVVEKMGGQIWVESRPGEGSTFYFTVCAAM